MPPSKDTILEAAKPTSLKLWRAVEAQHVVSTLRLAGNDPQAQDLLEQILEESKPPLPPRTSRLHYLLSTPFRYPPRSGGSRFRGVADPGVFYGGLERRTSCAEMGYWRWRFVKDSDGLREIAASPQTLFQVGVRGIAIDLQKPPLQDSTDLWTHSADYTATQALGRAARDADVDLILYQSARDTQPGICAAVLDHRAFRPKRPLLQETWHLTVTEHGAIWKREHSRFVFRFATLAT